MQQKCIRKAHTKGILKNRLSLPVDIVKQGGGTTNTGNIARSFFVQAKPVTKITGLDVNLIEKLHVVLQVITCGRAVNIDKFRDFCFETA